ncbi:response regulator receiver protein [Actinomycetes bacterium KLBMP 9759]
MIDEAVRCGYSKCRAELPPPGPQGGRRRTFCRDTRWEGGRTCAQMARSERDALDALGLDSGRATFALDADRLRDHIEAVRGPAEALTDALAAVSARLDEVQQQAVAAVEAANTQVAAAERARVDAETQRDVAVRRARQAAAAAEQAGTDRAEAVERAAAAARQALDATESLGAARQQAEESAATARAADARAETATASGRTAALRAERAEAEREAAARREQERIAELETVREELNRARAAVATLTAERDGARAVSDEAAGRIAELESALAQERIDRHAAERGLRGILGRLETETALRERAETETERLRAELAVAREHGTFTIENVQDAIAAALAGTVITSPANGRGEADTKPGSSPTNRK